MSRDFNTIRLNQHKLYIIGLRIPDGEYLTPATDKNPETAIEDYKLRQEIETLFGCLKTRGFNFG